MDFSAREVVLIEDTLGTSNELVAAIDALLTQMEPSKVFISSRSDSSVCDFVLQQSAQRNFSYDILKSKMFAARAANVAIDDLLHPHNTSTDVDTSEFFALLSELKLSRDLVMAVR